MKVKQPQPAYFFEYLERRSSSEIFSNPSILYLRILRLRIISQIIIMASMKKMRRENNLIIIATLWMVCSSPSNYEWFRI